MIGHCNAMQFPPETVDNNGDGWLTTAAFWMLLWCQLRSRRKERGVSEPPPSKTFDWAASRTDYRAGARGTRKDSKPARGRSVSQQKRVREPKGFEPSKPHVNPVEVARFGAQNPFDNEIDAQVEEWLNERIDGGRAKGTRENYARYWDTWREWLKVKGQECPYLQGADRAGKVRDEELLLKFVGLLGWLGKAAGTIRNHLFGIQYAHLKAGLEDPLANKERVWLVLDALRRERPPAPRKLGVTPAMLLWIKKRLRKGNFRKGASGKQRDEETDAVALWAALCLGFFFLLRAGEYLGSTQEPGRLLHGKDVSLKREGMPTRSSADEALINIRLSKSDQYAFGVSRSHFRVQDDSLPCVVAALEDLRRLCPERFENGREVNMPLCRWADGSLIERGEVQNVLQEAAEACGLPPTRFKSHSLRIGGASALYHAVGDMETVKRYGRWSSSAFHTYLWDSAEQSKGIAEKMAKDIASVHFT